MAHHWPVRTTLSLDDETYRLLKRYAESRSLTLGTAVSELVRRGFTVRRPTRSVHGLNVFDLAPESPQVTGKRIREIEAGEE
jgi:hypothetical protein